MAAFTVTNPTPERLPALAPGEKENHGGGHIRVLCLGNNLLADDAFGGAVAEQLRALGPTGAEVVESSAAGFALLDMLLNASYLVVVDTVLTGTAAPGTLRVLREAEVAAVPGGSPHYVGLFEALALGRKLGLPVPEEVVILAVEAADCVTVGGAMHPAVQAALPVAVNLVQEIIHAPRPAVR